MGGVGGLVVLDIMRKVKNGITGSGGRKGGGVCNSVDKDALVDSMGKVCFFVLFLKGKIKGCQEIRRVK